LSIGSIDILAGHRKLYFVAKTRNIDRAASIGIGLDSGRFQICSH
jgi:hypothetical protein